MSKPLSNQEREDVRALRELCMDRLAYTGIMIGRVVEAETFWRETVKKTNPYGYGVNCIYCGALKKELHGEGHRSDCAWELAQT